MSLPSTKKNFKLQHKFRWAKKQVPAAIVLPIFTSGKSDGDRLLWRCDQLLLLLEAENDDVEEFQLRLYDSELHSRLLPTILMWSFYFWSCRKIPIKWVGFGVCSLEL